MVSDGKGRLFRTKDGLYLIYLPVDLAEDSMFPFKNYEKTKRGAESIRVNAYFKPEGDKLIIEKWKEVEEKEGD